MTFYAVIDTNVLVSALLSNHDDAATVQVIDRLFDGDVIPVYSNAVIAEYREVLHRPKFHFSAETVDLFLSVIEKFGLLVEPTATGAILPDMKDLPFYEIVMEKREDNAYLVTGNIKHFPKEPFIVTAREFLDIVNRQSN